MSNYIGAECPVCNKKFTQADDIVVCPICGAPHHRDCYKEKNECALSAEHKNGVEWRSPAPDANTIEHESHHSNEKNVVICPACNSANKKDSVFCQVCGRRVSETPPPTKPAQNENSWGFSGIFSELDSTTVMYGGVSPDEKIEGESVRDLAVYIGESSGFYLPVFKKMDQTSRTLTFNFAALIFGLFYFFYRKMYLVGGILLAISAISVIPSFLQMREALPQIVYEMLKIGSDISVDNAKISYYQQMINLASTINFIIGLLLSFCANRFYYIKTMSDIKKIRAATPEPRDEAEYSSTLAKKGGTSRTACIIVFAGSAVVLFATVTYLLTQYLNAGGYFI